MAEILIVEDHANLSRSLQECLEREGYVATVADSLSAARAKMARKPDLIVLDWMLPDGQGVDLLTSLRAQGNSVPVIFLTARVELVDKVLGLEIGANDYMTKPFEPRELLARIRVQLRGASGGAAPAEPLKVGSLLIDKVRHRVLFNEVEIHLVKKEFDLLVLLAESPEKVFSRDEILNKVWGYDALPTTRTVDTHIMWLRQKLSEELIETVRAVGYRLKPI